jgi:hypothetical protein
MPSLPTVQSKREGANSFTHRHHWQLNDPAYVRIAEAAKTLNEQRERWLNPPEWIEPLAARIDAADDFADVEA